jgi:hypothetical protein
MFKNIKALSFPHSMHDPSAVQMLSDLIATGVVVAVAQDLGNAAH